MLRSSTVAIYILSLLSTGTRNADEQAPDPIELDPCSGNPNCPFMKDTENYDILSVLTPVSVDDVPVPWDPKKVIGRRAKNGAMCRLHLSDEGLLRLDRVTGEGVTNIRNWSTALDTITPAHFCKCGVDCVDFDDGNQCNRNQVVRIVPAGETCWFRLFSTETNAKFHEKGWVPIHHDMITKNRPLSFGNDHVWDRLDSSYCELSYRKDEHKLMLTHFARGSLTVLNTWTTHLEEIETRRFCESSSGTAFADKNDCSDSDSVAIEAQLGGCAIKLTNSFSSTWTLSE